MHGGWVGVFTSVQFREVLGLISDLEVKYQNMSSEIDYLSFAAALLGLADFTSQHSASQAVSCSLNLAGEQEILALNPRLLHH